MPNIFACPSPDHLRKFAVGDIAEADAASLEQHLDSCERCWETVIAESGRDTLLDAVRTFPLMKGGSGGVDELVEAMVSRIDDLRHWHPTKPLEATEAFDTPAVDGPRDTPTGAESSSAADDIDFLAPAEGPGELGRLGGYRILQVLGSGGMGVVFVAEDPQLRRRVALKVMRPALAASKTARQRFLREARLAASIEHDHLVHIYQVGQDRGMPFFAMQLLKGETLEERLRKHEGGAGLSIEQAVRIGRQIAEGLSAAHEQGLIHRDIKPANVFLSVGSSPSSVAKDKTAPATDYGLLTTDSRVKILDFGLARAVEDHAHITASGMIAGTPAYMAPEQARAEAVDSRTDLFSLGCVLYRMLVGRTPFRGANTTALLLSLATENPMPPCESNSEIPRGLSDLVMRLLAKNSNERPGTANEVVESLARIERQLHAVREHEDATPAAAHGVRSTEYSVLSTAKSPHSAFTSSPSARTGRRRLVAAAAAGLIALVIAAIAIIRISTPEGDYVIDTDDPSFAFSVSKGGVILEDRKTKRKYKLKVVGGNQAAGEFELDVTDVDADLSFKTKKFTIKRGQRVALETWFERKQTAAAIDPDRRAAEYVLSIGGLVRVNGEDRDIKTVATLPEGPFRLTSVDLGHKKYVTDMVLAYLKNCHSLARLCLRETQVTDAGLVHIKDCRDLMHLDLHWTQVSDAGLLQFKDLRDLRIADFSWTRVGDASVARLVDCKHLTELYLGNTQVSDAGLVHKVFKNLTKLLLQHTRVTDNGLSHLKDCKNLTVLDLSDTQVTDAGLAYFKGFKNLEHLSLGDTQVTDAGLAHFKDCKNLWRLYLHRTQVTDAGLAYFKGFKNLQYLFLDGTRVTDAGLAHFKDCKNLWSLHLDQTQVTDAGLAHFEDCKNLRGLHLEGTRVTDSCVAALTELRGLEFITLKGTKMTAAGVQKLAAALPKCKIESDHGTFGPQGKKRGQAIDPDRRAAEYVLSIGGVVRVNGEDRDIKTVATLPEAPFRLTSVDLGYRENVTDMALAYLKNCHSLARLLLRKTQVTDAGLVHVKDCRNLMHLDLHWTKVSDAGLLQFKDLRDLRIADFSWTRVGDAGVACLAECKNLTELYLGETRVSDAALVHKIFENLTKLHLQYTRLTDNGLSRLKDCKNLTVLDLSGTQVTDLGLVNFKDCKNLIDLHLSTTRVSDATLALFKDCKNLRHLGLGRTRVTDAGLAHFKHCRNLAWLHLDGTQVTDAGLAHFKHCRNLAWLHLDGTQVTDAGLAHFKDCKNLVQLCLADTQVTDAGLAYFKGFKNLEYLFLDGTRVTDAGLAHFKHCKNLWRLHLDHTQVTDAGLAHFEDCKNLRGLHLEGTRVTDKSVLWITTQVRLEVLKIAKTRISAAGYAQLAAALPKCKIE
jgi:serine/threonine protein kinase/Leucine-rich repeat (LRR) protein